MPIRRGGLKWRVSNPYNSESVKGERKDGEAAGEEETEGCLTTGWTMPGISQNADKRVVSGVRSLNGSSVWCFSTPLSLILPPLSLSLSSFFLFLSSSFSLCTSRFQSTNPNTLLNNLATFCTYTTQTLPATRYRTGVVLTLFCLIFIKNIFKKSLLSDNNVAAGCWSRGEHLLRDRVQVRSHPSIHANKTVEEHTFT